MPRSVPGCSFLPLQGDRKSCKGSIHSAQDSTLSIKAKGEKENDMQFNAIIERNRDGFLCPGGLQ
ncbi:MAG: hypothetical protein D3904_13995 [Candidatus Electrothrix sp. EH2]|nr:hypothetical protein [Candidatus Electrothrix sp. EH2]